MTVDSKHFLNVQLCYCCCSNSLFTCSSLFFFLFFSFAFWDWLCDKRYLAALKQTRSRNGLAFLFLLPSNIIGKISASAMSQVAETSGFLAEFGAKHASWGKFADDDKWRWEVYRKLPRKAETAHFDREKMECSCSLFYLPLVIVVPSPTISHWSYVLRGCSNSDAIFLPPLLFFLSPSFSSTPSNQTAEALCLVQQK